MVIRRPTSSTWLSAGVPFFINCAGADAVASPTVELAIQSLHDCGARTSWPTPKPVE
jgi:hypothetical protein